MEITNFINNCNIEKIKKDYNLTIKNDINNYYMINYLRERNIVPHDEIINYFSGTILEKDTNNLLYYFKGINKKTNIIEYIKKYKTSIFYIKKIYTGPIVKIFNYNDKWVVSTSYHTNAKKVFIKKDSKKSLYILFKDIIVEKGSNMSFFWNNLNKKYCYTFTINHKEIGNKSNSLIFLSKYDLVNRKEYDNKLFKNKINYKFNIIIPPSYKIISYDIFSELYKMQQTQKYIIIEKNKNENILNKLEIN